MTHVTCRLTAKNRDQLRNPTLRSVIECGLPLPFTSCHACLGCGLLLQTASACLLGTLVNPTITAKPIDMPFGGRLGWAPKAPRRADVEVGSLNGRGYFRVDTLQLWMTLIGPNVVGSQRQKLKRPQTQYLKLRRVSVCRSSWVTQLSSWVKDDGTRTTWMVQAATSFTRRWYPSHEIIQRNSREPP